MATIQVEDPGPFLEMVQKYGKRESLPGESIALAVAIVEHLLERSDCGTAKIRQIIHKTRPS